jgi:integrase/recombinase XerC/integrase/recombinase XerD
MARDEKANRHPGHAAYAPGKHRLSGLLRLYELSLRAQRLSPKTIGLYVQTAEAFLAYAGEVAAEDVRREDIERFLVELQRRGNSPATIHNRYRCLRRLFDFAVTELGLDHGPMDRMRPPRLEEKVIRPLEPSQVEAMMAATGRGWKGLRDAAILMTLFDCGIRRAECLRITLQDVATDRLLIKGKGGRERVVRLGYQAQMAIERYLLARPVVDTQALWLGNGGEPLGESGMFLIIRRLGKAAGIPDAGPHRLRHSFACAYLMGGGGRDDLQQNLGHTSPIVTSRYVKFVAQEHSLRQHEKFSPGDQLKQPRRRR